MTRRRFSEDPDPGETLHDVASDILHALGKGFLIASAGILLGAMIGTNHLAAFGMWMVGAAAALGAGSVIGSAVVRNARWTREFDTVRAQQHRESTAIANALPVGLEEETARPTDQPVCYVALLEERRAGGTDARARDARRR
jgi:hypothetical protein